MCGLFEFGLILKELIRTAEDDSLILFLYFSEKIRLDISCEWSERQTINMIFL